MAMKTANRRESDRIPMGVECALPWIPAPSSERPTRAKTRVLGKFVFAVAVLLLLLAA